MSSLETTDTAPEIGEGVGNKTLEPGSALLTSTDEKFTYYNGEEQAPKKLGWFSRLFNGFKRFLGFESKVKNTVVETRADISKNLE